MKYLIANFKDCWVSADEGFASGTTIKVVHHWNDGEISEKLIENTTLKDFAKTLFKGNRTLISLSYQDHNFKMK